jgi:hypothetical protein
MQDDDVGDVAQLVEHLLCKQGVVGSIPSISTIYHVVSLGILFTGKIEFRFFSPHHSAKGMGR